MDISRVWEELATGGETIVYLVLGGAAGLPHTGSGWTALQAAQTFNLDELARNSSCGMLEMAGPGITPCCAAGNLALLGYDPLRFRLGRGLLSALSVDFPLLEGDLTARVNFAALDDRGRILDRHASGLSDDQNRRLCARISQEVVLEGDCELFLEPVRGHRAVMVLRGPELSDALSDSDPMETGSLPPQVRAHSPQAQRSAVLVRSFLDQAGRLLAAERPANGMLLRGFQLYRPLPTLERRFGLRGLCLARPPLSRVLNRLIGMDVVEAPASVEGLFRLFADHYGEGHDFYYLHVRGTGTAGEEADFAGKVQVIEEVDALLPRLLKLRPEVLVVTADHSTPSLMAAHSWHPVPVLLHSPYVRADDVAHFDEYACSRGVLGLRPALHLMGLALANAGRLRVLGV